MVHRNCLAPALEANLSSRSVVSHLASRISTRRERVAGHDHHQFRTF